MRITDIRVDGFGVWNTMSVDQLSPGITLFYGPNEAGKTTLMQFVRAVLYGFSAERRKLYLPPVFGGVPGGMLRVQNHSGEFVVERREADKETEGTGRVIVLAANGSRQGQHLLNVLISGVDESIFHNVFAIGIRELQELATLNDTQAAEQLYNLASGVDRVSLVEVMRRLESARRAIWQAEDPEAELPQLLAQRGKLQLEVEALQRLTRRWADLATQRRTLVGEVAELDQRIEQTEFDARTVDIAIAVRDKWYARRETIRQRQQLGHLEPLPEDAVQRLEQLNQEVDQQREHLKPLKKRHIELRRDLAAQPINRALWDHSSRIEAMCEHGPWIAGLEEEIRRLAAEVETSEVELLRHEESLAAHGGPAVATSATVTQRILQQLQPAAQSLREASKKRSIAHKVQKKSRQDVESVVQELDQELEGRNFENFDEALEQTGQLVAQLRRRVQIEERLESLQRQLSEQNEEYGELLDKQFQGVRILAGIGGMFVMGFAMTLTGMFGWKIMPMPAEVCWGISLLGLICVALSVAWKMVLERTGQDELDEALHRRDGVQDEIDQLAAERENLEDQLPPGRGTLPARLSAAEKELRELEEMAPLQLERQRAEKRKQETQRRGTGVDEEYREARSRWRRALRQAGLPETLTAKHVRQLAAHHQKKAAIESRLVEQKERLEKLTVDRDGLVQRLEQLNRDVGLKIMSSDPQIQLSQLATALAGQREMAQLRRQWQLEERQLRKELAAGLQKLRRLGRAREALFAEARVTDEQELRERAERLAESRRLQEREAALSEQIQAIIGGHCPEDVVASELQAHGKDELQQRKSTLAIRLHDSQSHLAQLHQRHGEIKQEMKALSENRRLAAAKFELSCVETRIAQVTQQWRTLAATLRLLEDIRESYEAERQPETLSEASLYLEQLTGGKYTRIWTPLGQNELRIDDQEGRAMPLDVLSRGTREAVFLSLRLALVAAYGRRGVTIPMVLDDVLVNLDAKRAQAAVQLLCDFARHGRQLLFFTCHEHIKAMFLAAGVDTRVLPVHGTPGVHVVPLLEQKLPRPAVQAAPEEDAEQEAVAADDVAEAGEELVAEELNFAQLEEAEEQETESDLSFADAGEEDLQAEAADLEPADAAAEYIPEHGEEDEMLVVEPPQEDAVEDYYRLADPADSAPRGDGYDLREYQLEELSERAAPPVGLKEYLAELESEIRRKEAQHSAVSSAPDPAGEPVRQRLPISAELHDDQAFDGEAWWWDSRRRDITEEEEETAA